MRGFFSKPVDNLRAEPIIARWIRNHVPDWRDGVVVSKNAGGSKRVTSLADALKLSFGIITTDRRRSPFESFIEHESTFDGATYIEPDASRDQAFRNAPEGEDRSITPLPEPEISHAPRSSSKSFVRNQLIWSNDANPIVESNGPGWSSPHGGTSHSSNSPSMSGLNAPRSRPADLRIVDENEEVEVYTDERAREVITGRLIQGHIVDDDFPSPVLSTMSGSVAHLPRESIGPPTLEDMDEMTASMISAASSAAAPADHPLGGTYDAASLSDQEEQDYHDPEVERTVTLVGNVNDKPVFIIDDIIDGPDSWIAAAETVVKRGNARKVYCIATHALFGAEALEKLEQCDCIDYIVVCNTFPLAAERGRHTAKLIVLDLSSLLAEAIRRNHHGESISQLYQQYRD